MGFTNYIQKITDSNGTSHDLVDSSASHYVKGTQTASTNAWTGALPDGVTAYYDGLAIDYFLPYAGTSTAATLNLGSLGAKPVYVGNGTSAVTTHFPRYAVIHLTYIINSDLNSGNGCWKATGYYNTNTTYSAGTGLSLSSTTFNHSNSITAGTVGTSSATSGSTLAVPYVTYDAQGHITATGTHTHTVSGFLTSSSTLDATKLSGTIPTGCYTNTKNTAGSTDSSSKLFLIGATSQAANPQTYSHDTAYVGTDGHLYSNDAKVLSCDSLSSSGLTAYDSRCTITSGGYFRMGQMVFVQIRMKNSSSLGANNTWGYVDGFPVPATSVAALGAYASQNYGNIDIQINDSGRLVIATAGAALAKDTVVAATGWYKAEA